MTAQLDPNDQPLPHLDDGSGYVATRSDLNFLRLAYSDVVDMVGRIRPLGMSRDNYSWFCRSLFHALHRDGVTKADIRLQGSSAHFYSGWHKSMPGFEKEAMFDILADGADPQPDGLNPRPDVEHAQQISDTLTSQWPDPARRPARRPFDVMHLVGLDKAPSDYDVQISSDQMMRILRNDLEFEGLDPSRMMVEDSKYEFVKRGYAEYAFLFTSQWATRATKRLGRPVTWVLFPSCGPSENVLDPKLSSHHKESDWRVNPPSLRSTLVPRI